MENKKENIVDDLNKRAEKANQVRLELLGKAHRQKLLDEFAKSAMNGMLSIGFASKYDADVISQKSYRMANEMLKEREKNLIK
ncbi:hypothetical protein D3C85_896250 [compost metagenome]